MAGLKGSLVIFLNSATIFLSKPFLVFNPVPTAVPPCAKKYISSSAISILLIHPLNCELYPENSCPNVMGVAS